jgi:hypothetical protein
MREQTPDNDGTTASAQTQVDGPMRGTDKEAEGVQTCQLTERPQ